MQPKALTPKQKDLLASLNEETASWIAGPQVRTARALQRQGLVILEPPRHKHSTDRGCYRTRAGSRKLLGEILEELEGSDT